MATDYYDAAQICLNGHVSNAHVRESPERSVNYCRQCGAATITQCPHCEFDIRGHSFMVDGFLRAPAFCHNCGKSYPWTKLKIKAARKLAQEIDNLTADEKKMLVRSIDDIIRDSPEATLAGTRFRKLMAKAGKGAAKAMRDIVVDIASETVKKLIWPHGQ